MEATWTTVLLAALSLALGYVVRSLTAHPDLLTKLGVVEEVAAIAVRAVEQIAAARGWNSAQKYQEAEDRIVAFAQRYGIHLSKGDLQTLIEGAVRELAAAGLEIKRAASTHAPQG